jgi:hypothetical protein
VIGRVAVEIDGIRIGHRLLSACGLAFAVFRDTIHRGAKRRGGS